MKRISWPNLVLAALGLAVIAGFVYAFLPQPIPVDLRPLGRGPLRVTIEEEGRTRVRDRYVVSAPVSGRTSRVALQEGDPVRKGETVLVAIDPDEPELLDERTAARAQARVRAAEAALQAAEARIDAAVAERDLSRIELDRLEPLRRRELVSAQEFDVATRRLRVAESAHKEAQFAMQVSRFELEQERLALRQFRSGGGDPDARVEIRSPVDGCVLRVLQESATRVSAGTPLVEVGDPADLEVVVDLLSSDAVRIPPEARSFLEEWGGDRPLAGRVRRVEPSGFTKISALGVEEQRVNVLIDLEDAFDARRPLGDGFRVVVRIVLWEKDDVLSVPAGAVFRNGAGWAAFVADGRRATLRPLRLGGTDGLVYEVLDGLREGDSVILYPSDRVRDGASIAPRD